MCHRVIAEGLVTSPRSCKCASKSFLIILSLISFRLYCRQCLLLPCCIKLKFSLDLHLWPTHSILLELLQAPRGFPQLFTLSFTPARAFTESVLILSISSQTEVANRVKSRSSASSSNFSISLVRPSLNGSPPS